MGAPVGINMNLTRVMTLALAPDPALACYCQVAKVDAPVDIMMGIGGTPEGVIAACALKCMGGDIQGRLWPRDDVERKKALDKGCVAFQVFQGFSFRVLR